jgi:hypothetical protein
LPSDAFNELNNDNLMILDNNLLMPLIRENNLITQPIRDNNLIKPIT